MKKLIEHHLPDDGGPMLWKCHTPNLLKEILNCTGAAGHALKIPLQILGLLLAQVGERAAQINDPELNALMLRLAIYSAGDPESPDYDKNALKNELLKIVKP